MGTVGRTKIIVPTGGPIDAISTYDYDHRGHLVSVTLPDPSVNDSSTVTYGTRSTASAGRPPPRDQISARPRQ